VRLILLFSLALWVNDARAQGLEPETMAEVAARAAPAPEVRGILPSSMDLGALMPPPADQGPSSACSSFAVTYAAGSAALRQGAQAQRDITLSPALTYSAAGGPASCRGQTKISRTLDALRDTGTLPVDEYRFDPGWCARVPTAAERSRALQFRIAGWHYIDANDLRQVKGQLAQRHPVIFGLQTGPMFWAHRGDGVFATVE